MDFSLAGLSTVRVALRIMQLGILSVTISGCVTALSGSAFQVPLKDGLLWLLGFGFLLPAVLFCLASFLLMAAPARLGARRFGLLVMLFAHLQLVLTLIAIPFLFLVIFAILAVAAGLLMHLCFVIYLSRLSRVCDRSDMDKSTSRLLAAFVIVPLITWGISMVMATLMPEFTWQILGVIWGIAALLLTIWYLWLISSVCTALRLVHSYTESQVEQLAVGGAF